LEHSYDILGAGMLWKPKEARILTNFNECPNFKVQNDECHYFALEKEHKLKAKL
jgi:hypothetical protein